MNLNASFWQSARSNHWGIGLMLIGVAAGLIGAALSAYRFIVISIGGILFLAGVSVIIWPFLFRRKPESDHERVVSIRNDLQKFLDEVGPEPIVKLSNVPEAEYKKQEEKWTAHFNRITNHFERNFAPRIKDLIYRLGEYGEGDARLQLAMQYPEKKYETVKEILDRLSLLASRLGKK